MRAALRALGTIGLCAAWLVAASAAAAPSNNVHHLDWRVHVDLIDVGAGRDLTYFANLIDARHAQGDAMLQGHQGPFDAGCCTSLDAVSVTTFGTPGDGLDVVSDLADLNAVLANGDHAYLVQTIQYCGGPVMASGCGETPGDWILVAFDTEDTGFLAEVIAHERGHNAGLPHVSANACQLMQSFNGGGCLTVSECSAYIAKADGVSGSCDCLADTIGDPPETAGTSCGGSDVCSEGLCGDEASFAGVEMLHAAGAGAASGQTPDDWMLGSALSGGWFTTGAAGGEITALAWDPDDGILYGVQAQAGDDTLVTVDPADGAVLSTIGTLTGREIVAGLAFDPRPGGDRLYAVEIDDDIFGGTSCSDVHPSINPPCFSELLEIDPTDASIVALGELNAFIVDEAVTGLAWDDVGERVFVSAWAGLASVDPTACNGVTCPHTAVDTVFREDSALAFEPMTGRVLRRGDNGFGQSLFDVVDPATGALEESIGVDPFSVGGLAVRELPEPGGALGLLCGAAFLAGVGRRRIRP